MRWRFLTTTFGILAIAAFVVVGRHREDKGDERSAHRCYDNVACPNCGCQELALASVPETPGEHLLVNKNLYALRRPRRWELIVFQFLGQIFVKRILGLPGEWIEIRDQALGALAKSKDLRLLATLGTALLRTDGQSPDSKNKIGCCFHLFLAWIMKTRPRQT